jgi:prepilin-type processing-associated H-X9-DG protein
MKHFTLLELLVVCSTIGIITTMTLPSLIGARDKTKDAVCLSNLQQTGMSMISYTNKSKNNFPGHYDDNSSSWIEAIGLDDNNSSLCPSVDAWTGNNGEEIIPDASTVYNRTHKSSYGYNSYWLGLSNFESGFQDQPMNKNSTKTTECENPSELIMLADSAPDYTNDSYWSSTLWYRSRKDNGNVYKGVRGAHGKRKKRRNISFVDGHAKPLKAFDVNHDDNKYKSHWNPNSSKYSVSF